MSLFTQSTQYFVCVRLSEYKRLSNFLNIQNIIFKYDFFRLHIISFKIIILISLVLYPRQRNCTSILIKNYNIFLIVISVSDGQTQNKYCT